MKGTYRPGSSSISSLARMSSSSRTRRMPSSTTRKSWRSSKRSNLFHSLWGSSTPSQPMPDSTTSCRRWLEVVKRKRKRTQTSQKVVDLQSLLGILWRCSTRYKTLSASSKMKKKRIITKGTCSILIQFLTKRLRKGNFEGFCPLVSMQITMYLR